MGEPGFQVEYLLHSLKEIQQEKNCLEQKLNERRNKRRELEQTLESVNSKVMQVGDVHAKMLETMKVAQHKVSQTQAMADSLEELSQTKRKAVAELNSRIESEKENEICNVTKFEDELSMLADKLIQARDYYMDEHLNKEIHEKSSQTEKLQDQVEHYNKEVDNLNEKFREIELVTDGKNANEVEIPLELRKDICSLFEEENSLARKHLEHLQNSLDEAKQTLEQMNCDNTEK